MIATNNKVLYKLTEPQKRIWYTEKVYPNTSLYNIGGTVRIKGNIEINALKMAINTVIKKNDGLRLRMVEKSGEVKQYVNQFEWVSLDTIDFSSKDNPEKKFGNYMREEFRKPFLLEERSLCFFAIFKLSEMESGYFIKLHHIIADGWSVHIITKEICDTYMKIINKEEVDESPQISYLDYINDENEYISSDRFLKNKIYWNKKFQTLPELFLQEDSKSLDGKRKTYGLCEDLSTKMKHYLEEQKISLNVFFIGVYLVYLYLVNQQEDIIIGIPVMNRYGRKQKSIVGMFTNTMPFRFQIDVASTITDMMTQIDRDIKQCYYNQKYPYNLLIQDLELRKQGYHNLFHTCINYYSTMICDEINGYPIENIEFYNGKQIYPLQIIIKEWYGSDKLSLEFDYKVRDYNDEHVDKMYHRLIHIMDQMINSSVQKVSQVSLLNQEERNRLLYQFNDTKTDISQYHAITQLFEEQAVKTPNKVALEFEESKMTYKILNERSNQLAKKLVEAGMKRESVAGLLTGHSMETIIGILAILKAGGAYLPLDVSYPIDRLNFMLANANPVILLTDGNQLQGLKFNGLVVDVKMQSLYTGETANLPCRNAAQDLAYIIYTSGSTGQPKGMMIEHGNLLNYIIWAKETYITEREEAFPLFTSLAFDLTVTSIFTPLVSGGAVIIYRESEDEYVLHRIVRENKVTIIKLTPSHLSVLKELDIAKSSVHTLIAGGEDLKVSLSREVCQSFDKRIKLYNEYGPTETTVGCMIYKFDGETDHDLSVPIGKPISNVQVYILDKNHNPVPEDVVGELYISGASVGRGYANLPQTTEEVFLPNPFLSGGRMYKTGDLCKFIDCDTIQYSGRADRQVKVNGFRIEMGEIEKYLKSMEGIKDTIINAIEQENGSHFLCAYYIKASSITEDDIRKYLLKFLPYYMIPMYFVELDKIPLTINGKVDRKRLPILQISDEKEESQRCRNESEQVLVRMVCEVIGLKQLRAGQNFFQLGGDSIKAIQLSTRLQKAGYRLKVNDILSHPVIEVMAVYMETEKVNLANAPSCGEIEMTPIVSWFLSQKFKNPNHYNQSILLNMNQYICGKDLSDIFQKLIGHHDALRINYNSQQKKLFYNERHLNRHPSIEEYNLTELSKEKQSKEIRRIAGELTSEFRIESDLLIKACVFYLAENHRKVFITAHHLIVDGISWRVLAEDLHSLIEQRKKEQEMFLPHKTNSFKQWAKILNKHKEIFLSELAYWETIEQKEVMFPIDYDLGADTVLSSKTITKFLDEEPTKCLMTSANISYGTQAMELLILALARAVKKYSGNSQLLMELEGHGREALFEDIDISRTIGWFTSIFPVYVDLRDEEIVNQLKNVKETIRNIPHKGIGYGVLKSMGHFVSGNGRNIRFNYLGEVDSSLPDSVEIDFMDRKIGMDSAPVNNLTCAIDINCCVVQGRLVVSMTYSENKMMEKSMNVLMDIFFNQIFCIMEVSESEERVAFTPSDFDTVELSIEELEDLFQ